ncbi:MAG: YigZ family protein [Candidatus Neomarinimicrobiota bacterium]
MITPQAEVSNEIKIRRSRFIGYLIPVNRSENVQFQLNRLRELYPDASHICWAYRIREGKDIIEFSTDAGEPGGTAGIHLLNMLKKFDLVNSLIGVIRYFGGTKLGKSGLAKAYSETAQSVVEKAKLVKCVRTVRLMLEGPYEYVGKISALLNKFKVRDRTDLSGEKLMINVLIPIEKKTDFCDNAVSISSGNIRIKEME